MRVILPIALLSAFVSSSVSQLEEPENHSRRACALVALMVVQSYTILIANTVVRADFDVEQSATKLREMVG